MSGAVSECAGEAAVCQTGGLLWRPGEMQHEFTAREHCRWGLVHCFHELKRRSSDDVTCRRGLPHCWASNGGFQHHGNVGNWFT
jgi:hypothetical protein